MSVLPNTLFKFLFFFIKKHKLTFALMQLCALVWVLEFVAWPNIIKSVVDILDEYSGSREDVLNAIWSVILLGGFIWFLIEVGFRSLGFLSAYTLPKLEADIRLTVFEYVNKQSHAFFANNFSGSLANKLNDLPRSSNSIVTLLISLFIPLIVTTAVMTYMFLNYHILFGIVILSWVLLHIGICLLSATKSQELSDQHAHSRTGLAGTIVDIFLNNVNVRIFSRYKHELNFISKQQEVEKNLHITALLYMEKVRLLLGLVCFIFMGLFLTWLEIYAYKMGYIDIAEIVFIMQGSINITAITWWAGHEMPRLFQEMGVAQQALDLLKTSNYEVSDNNYNSIAISKGEIEFKNVTFRYERNNNLFANQNILINHGQKIGLVGFSGSGKTTFVNLILRYFDINEGQILIDGTDISKVNQDSLREQISLIPQEPSLFNRSIIENIRYGNPNASDEEVIEAAKSAHCHEFIMKMKDKYNTMAGEKGSKLSGGQRQRIAIARAILKKAPILIMDEATSALDSITENYIQESIEQMSKNSTTLIIAHRLSTLAGMDRILVFRNGEIIEDGSHEELLEHDGHYKELWDMQSDGFLPDEIEDEIEDETK